MTPVKREELPELPEGWSWDYDDSWIATLVNSKGGCLCEKGEVLCQVFVDSKRGELRVYEPYSGDTSTANISVVAAVLFANGVTLPEVPGRSSLLGGK